MYGNNVTEMSKSALFTIFLPRRELSETRTLTCPRHNCVQITCDTSNAYRVQNIVCHLARRDSSAVNSYRVEIASILSFVSLAEIFHLWIWRGNRSTRRRPHKPHNEVWKFKFRQRLKRAPQHWWKAPVRASKFNLQLQSQCSGKPSRSVPKIIILCMLIGLNKRERETASLAQWLRRAPRERKIQGSDPACDGIIPVT